MSRITPFLWFETQAEEAANFYVSVFPDAKLGAVHRFPAGGHGPEGSVMAVSFDLGGQGLVALNGNRKQPFSAASSLMFHCDSKEHAEELTTKLAAGGERQPGGWVLDRYGVSWQVALRAP